MKGADYADYLALLGITPAHAEPLLHSLKQATGGIGLYANTMFMYFKLGGVITTFRGKPLKLADKFSYFGSNITSTENDVSIRI